MHGLFDGTAAPKNKKDVIRQTTDHVCEDPLSSYLGATTHNFRHCHYAEAMSTHYGRVRSTFRALSTVGLFFMSLNKKSGDPMDLSHSPMT